MSAPYKKKKDKSRVPCMFYQKGSCTNQHCPYLHVRGQASGGVIDVSVHENGNAATKLLTTMLRLVFEKQEQRVYNAVTGLLDLSELAKLPDLRDVSGSMNFNTQSFCSALCATIKSLIVPPPSALQLRGNGISSLFHLAKQLEKAGLHESVRAISLEKNEIRTPDTLRELRGFPHLQELVLSGNPVAQRGDYRADVRKALPGLLGLDGAAVAAPPLALPWPRLATGADYSEAARHVLQFIESSLLGPLSADGAAGGPRGVDAVSDVYAHNAVLTLSLSAPEAAVTAPAKTTGGGSVAMLHRIVISQVVSLRLKQTESNHNLLHGVKSTVVATGRTKVCSQLEHWLYPQRFNVQHILSGSANVAFLDNMWLDNGAATAAAVPMKAPVTVVTLHGVMVWTHRGADGPVADTDRVVIRRNFTRVLTVLQNEAGRWHVSNDMVSLYPFAGDAGGPAPGPSDPRVLFSPRDDRDRAARLGRRTNVPAEVVAALCQHVESDAELLTVLGDLGGVPLSVYEHCATLTGSNALESIQICRIGNRFGLAPSDGLALLRQTGGDWCAIESAMSANPTKHYT